MSRVADWRVVERWVSSFLEGYDLDPDARDDLRQDCLLRILQKFHTFEARSSLPTWIYRIVRNQVISADRRQKARRERLIGFSAGIGPSTPRASVEDRLLARVMAGQILAGVEPLDREILRRRYLEGCRSNQVGEALGLAPSTVRVRTIGCRRRLRALFKVVG